MYNKKQLQAVTRESERKNIAHAGLLIFNKGVFAEHNQTDVDCKFSMIWGNMLFPFLRQDVVENRLLAEMLQTVFT